MSRVVPVSVIGLRVALVLLVVLPSAAVAHEQRAVGSFKLAVGWADEPPYVGYKNAIQLVVRDASGKPVSDVDDTLGVEVIFGAQRIGPLPLQPAFDTPGEYRAAIIPTRPGDYSFRFIGSIRGQKVDVSFTSSEKTFDPVKNPAEVEFPARDPTRAELAGRLERLGPRVEALAALAREARDASAQAQALAVVGIVLGAAALVVSLVVGRRRGAV